MTAQFPDRVVLDGQELELVGVNGQPLFDPTKHGLLPRSFSSACWRGHICRYVVCEDEFLLDDLVIAVEGEAPTLSGRDPQPGPFEGTIQYKGLHCAVPFTGGLLLARDFIEELYVHMGFHPAWKYRQVWEVILDEGHVTARHDRSQAMAEVRTKMRREGLKPGPGSSRQDIHEWIEKCFSLDY